MARESTLETGSRRIVSNLLLRHFCVARSRCLYDTQTKVWDLIRGLLKQLGVGPDGVPWGFNNAGTVYEYNTGTANWNQISGSTLSAISVGADEAVWGLNGSQIYRAHQA